MPWEDVLDAETEIIAIHAALLPTSEMGDILYFGDWSELKGETELAHLTYARLFRIASENIGSSTNGNLPDTNAFCGGQAFLADGRLLVAGGTRKSLPGDPLPEEDDEHKHGNMFGGGERGCWIYEPRSFRWTKIADLSLDPNGAPRSGGRWYPSVVTLPNGQVFAVGGHPDVREHYPPELSDEQMRHNNNTPERYSLGEDKWTLLTALTTPNGTNYTTDSYHRFHVLPNGLLFSDTEGISPKRSFDPYTGGEWVGPDIAITDELNEQQANDFPSYRRGSSTTSVLLPLLPPLYRPRILTCNGVTAFRIDVDESPLWVPTPDRTGSAAVHAETSIRRVRSNACAVLLPTGRVLVVGGVSEPADEGDLNVPVLEPELYDPGDFSGQEEWVTIEEPATVARGYHSVALLLPDGRVWTAGSTKRNSDNDEFLSAEKRIEIYRPAYVSFPNRPQITDSPSNVSYGQAFQLQTPQANAIQRVALLRCGSVTHAFDSDQRYVGLQFNQIQPGVLQVIAPPNANIAPPGFYMLWIVDDEGRPCQLARFIRVSNQKCSIYSDISTFSRQEVEALGTSGTSSATFLDAFHIVYDGFLPDEVLPPVITLSRPDNTTIFPGTMDIEYAGVDYEVGVQEKDVAQSVVYSYNIIFDNMEEFDAIPTQEDSRIITLSARMGFHVCQTHFVLSKNPNPRMSDVGPDGSNPYWLSVDLRVFKTKPDEALSAGIIHGSGGDAPFDYIQMLLDEYNSLPADDNHPFLQLPTDLEANRLALYSEYDDGEPIYNYAVAKVRYRAPRDVNAEDVRVFFRLCTTGATGLEYDRSSTYRRHGEGADAVPLLGLTGGEITYIPCFAEPRESNMEEQTDNTNRRTLEGADAQEAHAYFGCFLDINQDEPRYPLEPEGNGPFEGDLLSVQELMRGLHQCLVAEIHYPPDPILNGVTPGSSDNLAQRNILLDESDNPGGFATHLVHHTFEIKPSPVPLNIPDPRVPPSSAAPLPSDELVIDWGNLPRDTHATLFLPNVDVDELLAVAASRQASPNLVRGGTHTLRCKITDITFIPIPGPRATNIPALMTLQLPPNLTKGQKFSVIVRQVQGRTRRVMGTFQFDITVSTATEILPRAKRNLSVLRHIAQSITKLNRWYPIFERYLDELAGRVRGLGGNPDSIAPSPTGSGRPADEPCPTTGLQGHTGKICQIIYDCFGDFEGFVLDECSNERVFKCKEKTMEELVRKACSERIRVTIYVHNDRTRAFRIVLHC